MHRLVSCGSPSNICVDLTAKCFAYFVFFFLPLSPKIAFKVIGKRNINHDTASLDKNIYWKLNSVAFNKR